MPMQTVTTPCARFEALFNYAIFSAGAFPGFFKVAGTKGSHEQQAGGHGT